MIQLDKIIEQAYKIWVRFKLCHQHLHEAKSKLSYGRDDWCIFGCKYCPVYDNGMKQWLSIEDRGSFTYSYGLSDIEKFETRKSSHLTCTSDVHDHGTKSHAWPGQPTSIKRWSTTNWWGHANTHNVTYIWLLLLSLCTNIHNYSNKM